ncbi:response regulator [bacterium CPR1]|nr:response regulator [bacterium CPR1]
MDSLSILLLEDDETLRELLESTLVGRGYRVVAVGRGDEAIERGRQGQFDLIIADVRMEGTDGLTALGQVKSQQPDIRSIVITGYSTEADSIRAIRLGVGDYLKKPFRVGEFMEVVERQAERCRLARVVSQRELDLLKTAVWGLEQALDAHGSAREAGRLAETVALALGMAAGPALETRLLTLARALGKAGPGQPTDLQQRPGDPGRPRSGRPARAERQGRECALGGPCPGAVAVPRERPPCL